MLLFLLVFALRISLLFIFFPTRSTRTCRCHGKWSFLGSSIFLVVKNPYDLRSQIRFLGSLRKTHPYCWFYSLDSKRVLTFPSKLFLDSPQISVSLNVQDVGRVLVPKIVLSFAQQNTPPLRANLQHVTITPSFGASYRAWRNGTKVGQLFIFFL